MSATLLAAALLLAPGPVAADKGADKKALVVAQGEVPEARVIDVAIEVFAPGVSDTPASPLLEKGIRASVRKSEARYIPTHLGTRCSRRVSGGPCAWCRAARAGPSCC